MKKNKSLFNKFVRLLLIGIFVIAILGYAWYEWTLSKEYAVPQRQLEISPGLGVKQISSSLETAGIIHNDFVFRTFVWQQKLEEEFIAGVYVLPEKLNMKELVRILTSHNTVDAAARMRFIEGWSIPQIAEYLHDEFEIAPDDWYASVGYPIFSSKNNNGITTFDTYFENKYDFLQDRPNGVGYEGYIFPDTYLIPKDVRIEDILEKAFDNFDSKFSEEMRQAVKDQGRTIYEVVTIASILEREFQDAEEKKIGAGIIQNRLAIGMALQMDSTVNYITGKGLAAVTSEDLQVDSPYNTYMYPGLPPGPIANPGLDSLIAAVYPSNTDYMYFLHDLEGNTYFSKSFDEHVQKKNLYLR